MRVKVNDSAEKAEKLTNPLSSPAASTAAHNVTGRIEPAVYNYIGFHVCHCNKYYNEWKFS